MVRWQARTEPRRICFIHSATPHVDVASLTNCRHELRLASAASVLGLTFTQVGGRHTPAMPRAAHHGAVSSWRWSRRRCRCWLRNVAQRARGPHAAVKHPRRKVEALVAFVGTSLSISCYHLADVAGAAHVAVDFYTGIQAVIGTCQGPRPAWRSLRYQICEARLIHSLEVEAIITGRRGICTPDCRPEGISIVPHKRRVVC